MKRLNFLVIFVILFSLSTVVSIYASEYRAFSLKIAKERITNNPKEQSSPEIFNMGGITVIEGLVYDQKTGDAILVGKKDPDRPALTLDDLVVALRARFIHNKWPLVSIDPIKETEKTKMQIVRFEGGIEDTQFGKDLFIADYDLKKMVFGFLPSGLSEVKSQWDLAKERVPSTANWFIGSRFWFYPVSPSVLVREGVIAIRGLKVSVFRKTFSAEIDGKEIENASTFQDTDGAEFAKSVHNNFEELAKIHPSFSRLAGLNELVALSKAIEEMEIKPGLSFWLDNYQVKVVETKREEKLLEREEEYEISATGGVYKRSLELSGGVQLVAIALDLKAGDVTALRKAVLTSRPSPNSLTWGFILGEWLISTSPEMLKVEDVTPLFAQAVFLQDEECYDDAITIYGNILELRPNWYNAYNNRGLIWFEKNLYDQAISDFNKALELNPDLAESRTNRGLAYFRKGLHDQAISDFNKALELNPRNAKTYINRGTVYDDKGLYDQAISDFNKALELNPDLAESRTNRGLAYFKKGLHDQAISDFNKALELNPRDAKTYSSRGVAYLKKGLYEQAFSDFDKALELNPEHAGTYFNKALGCIVVNRIQEAVEAFKKYIQYAPAEFASSIELAKGFIKILENK